MGKIKKASMIFLTAVAAVAACSVTANAAETQFTITDATNVQKYAAKIIDLSDEQKTLYDLNEDGNVDITDATTIQKRVAQIITPTYMYLDKAECSLVVGEKASLSIKSDMGNLPADYTSSDESVVKVDDSGEIVGVAPGTAVITAKAGDNDFTPQCTVTVVESNGVVLDKTSCNMFVGETYKLNVVSSDGTAVSFGSESTDVISVSSDGTVTAVGAGTAVVEAVTEGGASAQCKITVKEAPQTLNLNETDLTLRVGETYVLEGVTDGNSTVGVTSSWSNSSSSVIAVQRFGENKVLITAKNKGESEVTLKLFNGLTASCSVTVNRAPGSMSLNASSITLGVGETYTLNAVTNDDTFEIPNTAWKNSDSSALSVSADGDTAVITGKSVGTSVVAVRLYNGVTAKCNVTVKAAPSSISLNTTSLTLGVGEKYTLTGTTNAGSYASAANTVWSSSSGGVASVTKGEDNRAEVTANSVGTTTIRVKLYNGVYADCKVTVKEAPSSVSLNTTYLVLGKGEKYTLSESTNSGSYANAENLSWSSGDTGVATVEKGSGNTAVVYAKGTGSTTITIKLYNGKSASCTVIVPEKKNVSAVNGSVIKDSAAWSGTTLKSFSAGAKLNRLGTSGNWVKVEYNGTIGYVYNRTFKDGYNYSSVTTSTLGAVIDDWFFEHGTDMKTIFNYCHNIGYSAMSKGGMEEMCVHVIKYRYGACYHHAAILQYMLDRAGYEAIYIQGIDKYTGGGPHAWVMVKTSDGWRHIDATKITGLSTFYLVKDSVISPYFSWDRDEYPAAN